MKQIKTLLTVLLLTLSTLFTYSQTQPVDTLYIIESEFHTLDIINVYMIGNPEIPIYVNKYNDTLSFVNINELSDVEKDLAPQALDDFSSVITINSKNNIKIFSTYLGYTLEKKEPSYFKKVSDLGTDYAIYFLWNNASSQSDTTKINYYTTTGMIPRYFENGEDVTQDVTLSIDETQSTSFNVFPNPTSDYINITGLNTNQTINILDINGRLVKTVNNYSSEQSIHVAELTPGFYFLKVDNKTHRFIKK